MKKTAYILILISISWLSYGNDTLTFYGPIVIINPRAEVLLLKYLKGNSFYYKKNQYLYNEKNGDSVLLDQNRYLDGTIFGKDSDVGNYKLNSIFKNGSDQPEFPDTLDFRKGGFIECVNFMRTVQSYGDFFCFDFENSVFFKDCDFQNLNFMGAHIPDAITFEGGQIKQKMNFSCLKFDSSSRFVFDDIYLPDTIDFSENKKIFHEINFLESSFLNTTVFFPGDLVDSQGIKESKKFYATGKMHYICLIGTDISNVKIDYINFKLYFNEFHSFSKKIVTDEEKKIVYEALLKKFKDNGQLNSYELLDIEYHDFLWKCYPGFYNWLRWIPKLWNNYGYSKGRVFGWALIFLFAFTILTFLSIDRLNKSVYRIENIPFFAPLGTYKKTSNSYRLYKRRLWYSLVYTASIFFLLTLKIEKIKFENKKGVIYLVAVYMIGILCLGYMANFVLQK